MNNKERAELGRKALAALDERESAVVDLLANLLHYLDQDGLGDGTVADLQDKFLAMVDTALQHWMHEQEYACPQCGEDGDDGDSWDGLCSSCADKAEEAAVTP